MIGTDIIEVARIKEAVEADHGPRFLERIFTSHEIDYCKTPNGGFRYESLAARFAAKEAVSKALGKGIGAFHWTDIEIKNDELGKPLVTLQNEVLAEAISMHVKEVHLSLSHTKEAAIAMCYLEFDR